jgi:hypothetical protein
MKSPEVTHVGMEGVEPPGTEAETLALAVRSFVLVYCVLKGNIAKETGSSCGWPGPVAVASS